MQAYYFFRKISKKLKTAILAEGGQCSANSFRLATEVPKLVKRKPFPKSEPKLAVVLFQPIDGLVLETRGINLLKSYLNCWENGVVGNAIFLKEEDYKKIKSCGKSRLRKIRNALRQKGLDFLENLSAAQRARIEKIFR
jgi:DNA-directed RNA polymerase alpha subunit